MKWYRIFAMAALGGYAVQLSAAPAECKPFTEAVVTRLEVSNMAFHAKAVEVEQVRTTPNIQKATFEVLHVLKGDFVEGTLVHTTVDLTRACSGPDCLPSIDVGDEMLVFYRSGLPHAAPEYLWGGCWEYHGIVVHRMLSVSLKPEP